MELDWEEIGADISKYMDNDEFLAARTPQQMCKILNNAKLSPCEFTTLFTNLSRYHGKANMLMMLLCARTNEFTTKEQAIEVSDTISSVLGIRLLDSVFSVFKNNLSQTDVRVLPQENEKPRIHHYPCIRKGRLYVKTLTGLHIVITDFDLNNKVEDLKNSIQDREGIPPDQQRLIYNGMELEDKKTLRNYGIRYGGTIHLVLRLRGAKPVIYLYPKEEIKAKVNIKINDGDFSFVYPSFDEKNTWNIKALPSGEIIHRGKKMRYLFWETLFYPNLKLDRGFCIKGKESVSFFEERLKSMNLNDTEICDFITYWGPKLCGYKYIKICFQFENFDEMCPMNVEPKPDNINRVFFAALPLDNPCDIEPQELPVFKRDGFTVIEWGGTIVTEKL
ncbi:Ubiquitin family protein [Trichomonas vaginalis G3]|uniref:Ubiquitin family protein n=1 Tax=Trichomonas vaginalis (strain ATCC PRA-98 / G3) TaxID=412133 RepID=A2DWT9_TRIV3|nr:cellular macromolecule catabolic process [Trichomonas vaginalis G3]EAY15121.1 Ubiquitin family protein [Trichomonas vaginalis G3]KAI5499187.1 cellular macromolecule catabolic process [Trichomonas vaginalis G3]|eukprot:XP_001327344.1 Ubiquitin family protein [Trichomonas vaginalis G3]